MNSLHKIAYTFLWLGGINWGLIGLFNYNLVVLILGSWPMLVTSFYILIGASAVYVFSTHKDYCKHCKK